MSESLVRVRTVPQKRDRLQPGEAPWPRLSETLTGPRHPDRCQKCGRTREQIDEARLYLQAWQEHAQDEAARKRTGQDVREHIFLLLCTACNREGGDKGKREAGEGEEAEPELITSAADFRAFMGG